MKQYYEAHITMLGNPLILAPIVAKTGWKFSAIDGDINLGVGIKCYATRQFNLRVGEDTAIKLLHETANQLYKLGAEILRRKIELVIFDDRSKEVKENCNGNCLECVE